MTGLFRVMTEYGGDGTGTVSIGTVIILRMKCMR
jgi:hypothetical protein